MNIDENIIAQDYGRSAMVIFTFLLIISGNFLGNLIPCRIQDALNKDIWLKHFLGFFTFIFVLLTIPAENGIAPSVYSLSSSAGLLYASFLILSKMPAVIWLIAFTITAFLYLLELNKQHYKSINKDNKDNEELVINNKNYIDNVSLIQKILTYLIISITAFGFIIYIGEKKIEYKKSFSYLRFIFGKPTCRGLNKNISVLSALKHAFI